ncbi:MAG: hypothetical protein JWQ71_995 [Pedosphaera sp.]|nr:hypothetical protein [Pedosphaera sp.]
MPGLHLIRSLSTQRRECWMSEGEVNRVPAGGTSVTNAGTPIQMRTESKIRIKRRME